MIAAATAGEEIYEDVTSFPAVHQDIAVVLPAETSAAALREAVLAAAGELLRSAEVFDLYAGEQLDEGSKSLALRLEFRAADRTLTDEEVAGSAGRSRRSWRRSEVRSVAETPTQPLAGDPAARVLVAGASGFTGALAAQLVWSHPRLELIAATSRSDAGKRSSSSTPATGCRWS